VLLLVLFLVGLISFLGTLLVASSWETTKDASSFFLILTGLSTLGWLLVSWNPLIGQWFTVGSWIASLGALGLWIGLPASMTLSAVPIALTAIAFSLRAAAVTGVVESLILLVFVFYPVQGLEHPVVVGALIAVWGVLGVMYAEHRSIRRLCNWLAAYYREADDTLQEAQRRKVEARENLDSLMHVNRQLELAQERAAALRATAEEAERAKSAFVMNVSHEFRTPLNMIVGLTSLMMERPDTYAGVLSPQMREDLEIVYRNSVHLSNMIDDVLDLALLEADQPVLRKERVDLAETIERCVMTVRPLFEKKQLALRVGPIPSLPRIYCDPTRVKQVVLNLLSNAARFTDEGSVTVEAEREDHRVIVAVRDTGQGISPDGLQSVFEPFWQDSEQTRSQGKGTGLGLNISRQFVKLHGGQMCVESELGVGTSFFFSLPISPPLDHSVRPGHAIREDWVWREQSFLASRGTSWDGIGKPRVVVYDETDTVHRYLARHSDDAELVRVGDPSRIARERPHVAVVNAASSETLPSLVLVARKKAPGIPIIGCSVPRQDERVRRSGAVGYLVKPVTRDELALAMRAVDRPVRRVLVVDDEPDVLRLLTRMLRAHDRTLDVVTVRSGEAALEELRRRAYDLMLLDVMLPDMDGWQVRAKIVRDDRIEDVPTCFVSARDLTVRAPVSEYVLASASQGVPLNKLLRCSLHLSALLMGSGPGTDRAPL
jgi:signal transduction histidine kinase/CheY-like chemotaxis protein